MQFDEYYEGECPHCDMTIRAKLLEKTGYNKIRRNFGGEYQFFCYMCPNCRVLFTTGEMANYNAAKAQEARDRWKEERRNG